jgi:hypothetical protein
VLRLLISKFTYYRTGVKLYKEKPTRCDKMLVYVATSSDQYTHLTAQRHTTQTAFQVWTPKSGTHYCTPDDGHTSARNMLSQ